MKWIVTHVLFWFLFAGAVYAQPDEILFEVSVSKFLMGTKVETTARHSDIAACRKALYLAYREMERVENLLSSHKAESEISNINRAAGIQPTNVSSETFAMIQRAKSYAQRFGALFDISIGPITERWGFNSDQPVARPEQHEIDALLKLVDYRNIHLDSLNTTVFLTKKGMKIDLGGIAKGYAIDRSASVLKQQNIRHFLLNAGGDIYISGKKDAQTAWRVGIKHPRKADDLIAQFDAEDTAIATSGDYERYHIIENKRYHHILDPRTGYPGTRSQSATVLSTTAEKADVLATYLFLLGYENTSREKPDTSFFIVTSSGTIRYNRAFSQISGLDIQEP